MAILMNEAHIIDTRKMQVVHPLDDVAEEKRSPEGLGEMPMSASVKYSLYALRGYLVLIGLMVSYRVLGLAGLLGPHAH